ncbi:hypothetical protein [Qipengyuania seohaensis]|uniref:hypothetical protein n=1 Tax=Qipengyuania seohaensis TaxID=266951 RepID=UPI0012FD44FD|nr:hypothetical protein [Qipengyuania seohaensis]
MKTVRRTAWLLIFASIATAVVLVATPNDTGILGALPWATGAGILIVASARRLVSKSRRTFLIVAIALLALLGAVGAVASWWSMEFWLAGAQLLIVVSAAGTAFWAANVRRSSSRDYLEGYFSE